MRPFIIAGILLLAACKEQASIPESDPAAPSNVEQDERQPKNSGVRMTISCHELLGGRPFPEPTIYELDGKEFYKTSPLSDGSRVLISSENEPILLSEYVDEGRQIRTFASHTTNHDLLTRSVFVQEDGGQRELSFKEFFDFNVQTVTDFETGEDSCFHDAEIGQRTAEDALWEATRGTGILD